MLRIIVFSVITCILSSVIKRNCVELYLPFQIGIAITALIYIFNLVSDELSSFFSFVQGLGEGFGIITSIIKAALITITTKLACDVCKENGNILIGDIIELGGKIMILIIAIPYIITIINISTAFLK